MNCVYSGKTSLRVLLCGGILSRVLVALRISISYLKDVRLLERMLPYFTLVPTASLSITPHHITSLLSLHPTLPPKLKSIHLYPTQQFCIQRNRPLLFFCHPSPFSSIHSALFSILYSKGNITVRSTRLFKDFDGEGSGH